MLAVDRSYPRFNRDIGFIPMPSAAVEIDIIPVPVRHRESGTGLRSGTTQGNMPTNSETMTHQDTIIGWPARRGGA
jgi:hypothetical protein